jgi:hypothetical protein
MRWEATSQLNKPAITNRDSASQSSWLIRARPALNFDLETGVFPASMPALATVDIDFLPFPSISSSTVRDARTNETPPSFSVGGIWWNFSVEASSRFSVLSSQFPAKANPKSSVVLCALCG